MKSIRNVLIIFGIVEVNLVVLVTAIGIRGSLDLLPHWPLIVIAVGAGSACVWSLVRAATGIPNGTPIPVESDLPRLVPYQVTAVDGRILGLIDEYAFKAGFHPSSTFWEFDKLPEGIRVGDTILFTDSVMDLPENVDKYVLIPSRKLRDFANDAVGA